MLGKQIYKDRNELTVLDPSTEDEAGCLYTVEHPENGQVAVLQFQQGSPLTNGVNGATNEAVLAVLIDRTKKLDAKFPSEFNKVAIAHMESALECLETRTRDRLTRGVEGQEVE